MKKHPFFLILPILLLFPASALADFQQEYITWGGHSAVVNAFNKSALIFSDSSFAKLSATLATASLAALILRVMWGLMAGGFKGDGSAVVFQGIIPWLISVALFMGTVLPKGTLHIYDQTENKYQAIGNIPLIIVVMASVCNKLERVMVEAVQTSGDPLSFTAQAGGKGFMGLEGITTKPLTAADSTLDATLQNYVMDCIILENSLRPGYTDELRRGTTDLQASFAKAVNPASFTVVHDADHPAGELYTCKDAWLNIEARLNAAGGLNNNLAYACNAVGFDASKADERNECLTKITSVADGQISSGKSGYDLLKTTYLAQQFDAAISGNRGGEANANFQLLNKASGLMSTANNWLPTIRAIILSITVALTPFLCLLMLTPMFGKVLKYLLGGFMLLTVWSVVDATIHQFIIDYSNRLYGEIRWYNLGIDAIRLMPETTGKVLAMFGMARTSGLALSIAIVSSVMGLSASVGSAIGGKIMGDVTQTGAQAEAQVLDPGQKAALRRSNQSAIPTETMANHHSFTERTTAEYSQQAGQLKHQLGAVAGAGGMQNYKDLREQQGFVESFKGGGEVALNQQMRAMATSMGISDETQRRMAASNVNSGEALFRLAALQKQGFSGEAAEQAWMQGAVADRMQSGSVGQQQGFTMYRPVEGQEQGKWGQVQATWQDNRMVGLQGNTVNVASTEQLRASYDKAYSQAISESFRADQSLGESVTKSWGNSATWSQTTAAAQQLYQATNGSVDYMKAVSSTMTNSFRNSQIVDERTGQSIDKSVFAQATAGVGTPQISPVKANIEGGASWRVTTNDGKSYVVNQSAEEARSMATNVGETHRTTLSTVRSGQYSETAQKALSQMESVQGSKTASENSTISYSRANEMREAQGQAHSRAADVSANLSRDFYRYVGEKQFGGGADGDREAIKHLEGLAASGQTKELDTLKAQYLSERNINVESLGANLSQVKGPDLSKAPDPEAVRAKIEGDSTALKSELASQPNLKVTDPTAQVAAQLKTEAGAVNPKEIKAELAAGQKEITDGKSGIEQKGVEIKNDYTAGALPLAARKSAEAVGDAAAGLQQLLPGGYGNGAYTTGGNSSQPQVAAQQPKAPNVEQSGMPVGKIQQTPSQNDIPVTESWQEASQNDVLLTQTPQPLPQNDVQPIRQNETPERLAAEVTGAAPVAPQQAMVAAPQQEQQPVAKPGIESAVRQPDVPQVPAQERKQQERSDIQADPDQAPQDLAANVTGAQPRVSAQQLTAAAQQNAQELAAELTASAQKQELPQVAAQQPTATPSIERTPGQNSPQTKIPRIPKGDIR